MMDKSNKMSPQKIKIMYPTQHSSSYSKERENQVRNTVAYTENHYSSKEAELSRKLSILESRVG